LSILDSSANPRSAGTVRTNIALPFRRHAAVGEVARPGRTRRFSAAHTTRLDRVHGAGTKKIQQDAAGQKFDDLEPYMGITPASRFELATATESKE